MSKTFKERIHEDREAILMTTTLDLTRTQLEVALGNGTYDAVYFDGQHSPITEDKIVAFCAMTEELGMPTQMRLPHTRQAHLAGRFCDLGLSSVMVPEVMTEQDVHDATEYFYYGTQGRRSWGGGARAGLKNWKGKMERLDYAKWWNNFGVLSIQFESVEAVANARRLADRPGIDYVAFGPNDLRFSLERHTNFPLKTVEECFKNVAEQLDPVGIPRCYAIATKEEDRDPLREQGITVFWEAARY